MIPNKSAETRFANTQARAKQMSMPMNQAAQQSLRKQTSQSSAGGPPVGSDPKSNPMLMGPEPTPEAQIPTGGPQMPPETSQDFDPEVFKENLLNSVVGSIRTEQFINSPRIKDAAQSVRLKNFFNATNPNAIPDNRNLLTQVLNRTGLDS